MKHLVLAFIIVATLAAPAIAAVECPATDQGRRLARADGASLYIGDPANGMLMAPTKQARSMSENNFWLLNSTDPVTLVCQYEGTNRALARSIPAETKQCVQNLSANTFACK